MGRADLVPRAAGVVAGLPVAAWVFDSVGQGRVRVEFGSIDGATVAPGEVLATVHGPVRDLLTAERTALNLLGHLSGVATLTRRWVDAVAGTGAQDPRHPQDHARPAHPGEVRGALRRRREPPDVAVGRRAGQGQPRRRGRRRRRGVRCASAAATPTCRWRSRSTPSSRPARSSTPARIWCCWTTCPRTHAGGRRLCASVRVAGQARGVGRAEPRPGRARSPKPASTTWRSAR